jgi:hypothetical protein
MQANLTICCSGCNHFLGKFPIDTADMPEELQTKVNTVILLHRQQCPYYNPEQNSNKMRLYHDNN